jgi:hypothetical protein
MSLSVIFALHITLYTLHSYATVPHLINYQGRLTDTQGQPLNGSYDLTFRIYDSETTGTLLWEETQAGVVIQKGIFSILLGSITNLDLAFDKPYFLEIKVGTEVMSPRQRITSAAYALRSETTDEIPKGAILMIKGQSCPSGYRRFAELDGKFIVGGASYNSAAGGSNTAILTTDNLPSHTHTTPDHTHTVRSNTIYGKKFSVYKHYFNNIYAKNSNSPLWIYDGLDPDLISGGGGITGSTGSNQPFDIRPAYATVVLCEKE